MEAYTGSQRLRRSWKRLLLQVLRLVLKKLFCMKRLRQFMLSLQLTAMKLQPGGPSVPKIAK